MSTNIGGGNGAVGDRISLDPGDPTSAAPLAWIFVLVFSAPAPRFAPALAAAIMGAVTNAVVQSVSMKSRMPK
jgi:hypothetical protein